MNKLAVIIPVVLQSPNLLDQFRTNLRTFEHKSVSAIFIICNRLSLMTPSSLQLILAKEVSVPVYVVKDVERSVAGAWNFGIELAEAQNFDTFLITALDVTVSPLLFEYLLDFEAAYPDCDLWSSLQFGETIQDNSQQSSIDGCDFSCFMLRFRTIVRHGWFDREFSPAYYEDDDYLTRLVIAGNKPQKVLAARHSHRISATIHMDSEVAYRVKSAARTNELRFHRKWGPKLKDFEMIRRSCFSSPYNSGRSLSWWPEQDAEGYSASGGVNE